MKLTKPQLAMLKLLDKESQHYVGANNVRLHNTLAKLGLAELTDDRGRPVKESWEIDCCRITERGREVLRAARLSGPSIKV